MLDKQPRQIIARTILHPRGDLLGAEFEEEIGHFESFVEEISREDAKTLREEEEVRAEAQRRRGVVLAAKPPFITGAACALR